MNQTTYKCFNDRLTLFNIGDPTNIELLKEYSSSKVSQSGWLYVHDWCQERFNNNWIWIASKNASKTLYFLHECDAILFKLAFPYI